MRLKVIATLIVCSMSLVESINAQESSLVYPGGDGKLVYVKHANTAEENLDNVIADYSNCGYMGGGVALPHVPVKITVYPELGDDRKRIQDAINYVESLTPDANGHRGAVLLKAGTYQVDEGLFPEGDALRIRANGVVLRGEGQGTDGTILKTTLAAKHQIIATRPKSQGFSQNNLTRITDEYVGGGAKQFSVVDAGAYAVGDTIAVVFTPNQTWLDEIHVNDYLDPDELLWDTNTYIISYERMITAIDGNKISIHSPIIHPMQEKYGGGEVKKLTGASTKRLQQIGVEDLRLVGIGVTSKAPENGSNRLKTGVHVDHTENSWVKGVTVVHTSNSAVRTWSSNYITVEDCASILPLGPYSGGYRYTFYIDGSSSHNLYQRTFTEDGRHDYVLGQRTPGPNVFLDGFSVRAGTIGPHQRWATGTLFDNLSMESLMALEHRGASGSGHGWAGIQSIIWNTESPSIICDAPAGHLNYAIGNTGNEIPSPYVNNSNEGVYRGYFDNHGSHVATRSLYLKQLNDRMGTEAVSLVTIPEQISGNIYDQLADWAGNGPLIDNTGITINAPRNLSTVDFSNEPSNKYVLLEWDDTSDYENIFIIERSSDGGENFEFLAQRGANIEFYTDTDIQQTTYHYRIKAVNGDAFSAYTYFFLDLGYEFPSTEVTFQVDIQEVSDLYPGGNVWVTFVDQNTELPMTDSDGDNIYTLTEEVRTDIKLDYIFSYQNGSDPDINKHQESIPDNCKNSSGFRSIDVVGDQLILPPILFGDCQEALPPGIDLTDLEGTIIIGSNDNEPWISGSQGAGSPDGERVEKLIDNNVRTKYLVRAEKSWVEITNHEISLVSGYTITSANDISARDPRNWELKGWDGNNEEWVTIHSVMNNPKWEKRLQNRSWTFENELWFSKYRLEISKINGDTQGLMQMAELQLFGSLDFITTTDFSQRSSWSIYPNPSQGIINIANPNGDNLKYKVYSTSGLLITNGPSKINSNIRIDMNGFKGLYIILIISGSQTKRYKVIVN
ncbi:MAG: T9SS type A sorting domain-containing protein [Reichenbachiella sp.]